MNAPTGTSGTRVVLGAEKSVSEQILGMVLVPGASTVGPDRACMMVTVRVAASGRFVTVPKAKLIIARRRRRKIRAQNVVLRQNCVVFE